MSKFPNIKKEVAWGLSNISAGNYTHAMKVLDSQLFHVIVSFLSGSDYRVTRESLWVICNICSCCNFEISAKLLKNGALESMINLINNTNDPRFLIPILEAFRSVLQSEEHLTNLSEIHKNLENPFKNFFERYNITDILEHLQGNQSKEVYQLSLEILEKYFISK